MADKEDQGEPKNQEKTSDQPSIKDRETATLMRQLLAALEKQQEKPGNSSKAASKTYYRTKLQEKSLKEGGSMRGKTYRRRERLSRKLQERTSIFQKSDLPPKAKEKWSKVLVSEIMSSEESGSEADDMFVRPLPWRSDLVNNFFSELDDKSMEKTPQTLKQRKKRMLSVNTSTRIPPNGLPKWAFKA